MQQMPHSIIFLISFVFIRVYGQTTTTEISVLNSPWVVSAVSLSVVAAVATLIGVGFCLGRRYCCKAPSVVLNTGNPPPFWHRAWNTMGVYRPCGGHHRCATTHHYCSRHA